MIKLIVTDMDGTLLNSKKELSPKFEDTYKQLSRMNIRFVVASGRPHYTLSPQFSHMKHDIILVGDNGAFIGTKPEPVISNALTSENASEILATGRNTADVHLVICTTDKPYTESNNQYFLNEARKYYPNIEIINDASLIKKPILKIAICDLKTWQLNSGTTWNKFADKYAVAKASNIWIDIMPIGVNKGAAVKYLQKIFGITKAETMTFGDFHNDIEMLKMSEYSYAMDNAHQDIKDIAKYKAPSNDDDGVIKTIEKLLF